MIGMHFESKKGHQREWIKHPLQGALLFFFIWASCGHFPLNCLKNKIKKTRRSLYASATGCPVWLSVKTQWIWEDTRFILSLAVGFTFSPLLKINSLNFTNTNLMFGKIAKNQLRMSVTEKHQEVRLGAKNNQGLVLLSLASVFSVKLWGHLVDSLPNNSSNFQFQNCIVLAILTVLIRKGLQGVMKTSQSWGPWLAKELDSCDTLLAKP